MLTIEPAVGDDPAPADTHILAGDFDKDLMTVATVGHPAALGTDFSDVSGSYILAAPSGGEYYNGIWFLDPAGTVMLPSLNLPELPAGWVYEGWAVVDGTPYSTGTFTELSGEDSDGKGATAGPGDTPPFPGQDFVNPALDLRGGLAVISVEPDPDNSLSLIHI